MLDVAITSPSLAVEDNVSGISNLTRLVILTSKNVSFRHVVIGRKDTKKRNFFWILNQVKVLIIFFRRIRTVKLVHLNIPLEKFSILINVVLVLICWIMRKKIIVHFRGGALSLHEDHSLLQRFCVRRFLKNASAVLVLGEKEKNYFKRKYRESINSKLYVLPNAVLIPDFDEIQVADKFSQSVIHFVYVGRIDLSKGLLEIVEALALCSNKFDYHFDIIGDGPDMEYFESVLRSSIGPRYTHHGTKSIDQIYSILGDCQIFLLPSHFEGLPNSLLEAMANCVVPIVTPVGSIPEVVSVNNGFLVEVNNYQMLEKAICKAVNDRSGLHEKSLAGRELMVKDYSIDTYCKKLFDIYNQTLR